jgi:predicted enzyme related to lactoylglutathione lyase
MKKMNPVVHFEMPADDRNRMAEFYSNVFGWETKFFGEEMGNYVTVSTTETDENGMIKMPGAINGGFFPKNENMPNNNPSIVIAVDDIQEHVKKISEAGGNVLGEPVDIPNVGLYVSFRDTEGNVCSILQPVMTVREKAEVEDYGYTGEI